MSASLEELTRQLSYWQSRAKEAETTLQEVVQKLRKVEQALTSVREDVMDEFGILHGEAAKEFRKIVEGPTRRIHSLIALMHDLPHPPVEDQIAHPVGEPCNYPHCPDYQKKVT